MKTTPVIPAKAPIVWNKWFAGMAMFCGMSIPVSLSMLIANYTIEYQYHFPYYITPWFWATIFVEIGLLVASFIGGRVSDAFDW